MTTRCRVVCRLAGCAVIAAGLGAATSALADPSPSASERGPRPAWREAEPAGRSDGQTPAWLRRGLSRVELQIDTLNAISAIEAPSGTTIEEHVMFDDISRDVRHWAKRATQRMVRDQLLEATDLERILGFHSGGGGGSGTGERRRMEFDFGIHSLMPEAEFKYRLADGQLKLSVNATGDVGLRFRALGAERGDFGIGFDGDDTYRLSFRVGF